MDSRFGTFAISTPVPLTLLHAAGPEVRRTIALAWAESAAPADLAWIHHWLDGGEVVLSLASDGNRYWVRAPGVADFLIEPDTARLFASAHACLTDAATLEHVLVDQILPRVLSHFGELMVHASALTVSGRHVLFTGQSGRGKSTLAGLLQRKGHVVLSDDCVQLVANGTGFDTVPTYPSLRLYADSLEQLFPGLDGTEPVASYSEKRRVPIEAAKVAEDAGPLAALYLLGDPEEADESVRITPLSPAETCQALLRHSFRLDLGDRAANTHQFALCAAVTRAVPAFRLDYPRDFTRSEELVQHVTDHLAHLPSGKRQVT